MAEQVNQRIEDTISELEQMRRTDLYDDDEIREIARRRKEFEYHIQRRIKKKEDFALYIEYELALLEDIATRREMNQLLEKKKDIEFSIAKRLNKLFKQFIYRFQSDLKIYFEYIKFCKGIGFDHAVSGIIGQMIQLHGNNPKVWQLASRWESREQDNVENGRNFLLKGLQRHKNAENLYVELFDLELIVLTFKTSDEEKENQVKRADIVWRNGLKNVENVEYLFQIFDLCLKYEITEDFVNDIKRELWARRNVKHVLPYIAERELEGVHWEETEQFVDEDSSFPTEVKNFMGLYHEALHKIPDKFVCNRYFQCLMNIEESVLDEDQIIKAVKQAWMFCHDIDVLTDNMCEFGIQMFKLKDESGEELTMILDSALERNTTLKSVWAEKIRLSKSNEKKVLSILQRAKKVVTTEDLTDLYNLAMDQIDSGATLNNLYTKFLNCEDSVLLEIKPKLLKKMYDSNGIKAARQLYEDLIKTPPTQVDIHTCMIFIEMSQDKPNVKSIRKCYECAVLHHGTDNVDIWMKYLEFETENNAAAAPAIYRRAIAMLKPVLVDDFIKAHTLSKIK